MTNVLPYHIGPRDQYSLEFVNQDREAFKEHLAAQTTRERTSFKSREVPIETEDGVQTLYAVYSNSVPDSLFVEEDDEEIQTILDDQFSDAELQILEVILDVFTGITEVVQEETGRFTIYKDMDLPKISETLRYPDWGDTPVTVVGGQLLSRFILAHPMPNANHRTGLGLLERYLRSHGDGVTVPDTGEQGTWNEWARPYIHDSKRLLTVRRNAHVFRYAREYGVDVIMRKNDVDIDLHEFDLAVDDPFEHFGHEHEQRSIDFVETILDQVDVDTERFNAVQDTGLEAFVEALKTD